MKLKKSAPYLVLLGLGALVAGAPLSYSAFGAETKPEGVRLEEVDGAYQMVCPMGKWPVLTGTRLTGDQNDHYNVAPPAMKCIQRSMAAGAWVPGGTYDPNYCPEGYGPLPNFLSGPGGATPKCAVNEYLAAMKEQNIRSSHQ